MQEDAAIGNLGDGLWLTTAGFVPVRALFVYAALPGGRCRHFQIVLVLILGTPD
jgi:hypothetical protein